MVEDLIIIKPNGERVPLQSRHKVTVVTSARQNWTLNGDDTVEITVESPFPQTYEIGDKINVFGRDYTLNRLPKPTKNGTHSFQYSLQFEGAQYDLLRATYDVTIDTTNNESQDVQGDSLTGDLRRFLTVLMSNANRVFPGKWRLGECPDTTADVTLTFGESDNCLSVLQTVLGKFDESFFFDITAENSVYVVNILSKSQILPFTLEFGKNKGLYMISRDNVSSSNIITRLKVFGSTSNITSKYRADRLCLPDKSKSQSFIEKPEAVAKYGIFEGRKHFEVKPTFTGKIRSVGSVVEFVDDTISFDLNAKDANGNTIYLLDGVAAKIHFNSGNLAGYEFEIAKYDHANNKITLRKFTDDRGDIFPSDSSQAFQFAPGDEYKILDITLPDELISAAENELLEKATQYYDQYSQPKVQYSVNVTKAYLEKNFGSDAGVVNVFVPGDYIHIKDPDIDVDKSIRIKTITRNILDPYDYQLTISDTVTTNITNRVISDIINIDKVLEINNLKNPARARANWRSSREVLDMVFDPEGDYYTDKIKPNSIDTLALSVGAKSMQFSLVDTLFMPNYLGNANVIKWKGGVLSHYAISDDGIKLWNIADGQITLTLTEKPYYIYARCNRNGEDGNFIITTKQYKVEDDSNYYYFLVGIVNSVNADTKARSLALMYGFTTINGRYISTGRIESNNGKTYFDLDSGEICGNIVFTSDGEKKNLEEFRQEVINSQTNIDDALNLAKDKNRVFITTPTPPYDRGDLWIVEDKILRRCVTARAKTQPYNANDWVLAVDYDNTVTAINGGVVTSGTVQLANGDSKSIVAGITGGENESATEKEERKVRIWAGASKENRFTAPFRVLQDGTVIATIGEFSGYLRTPFIEVEKSDALLLSQSSDTSRTYQLQNDLNILCVSDGVFKTIELPNSKEYIGARVLIYNNDRCLSRNMYSTYLTVQDGGTIYGAMDAQNYVAGMQNPTKISFLNYIIELVGIPDPSNPGYCGWMVLNYNSRTCHNL